MTDGRLLLVGNTRFQSHYSVPIGTVVELSIETAWITPTDSAPSTLVPMSETVYCDQSVTWPFRAVKRGAAELVSFYSPGNEAGYSMGIDVTITVRSG